MLPRWWEKLFRKKPTLTPFSVCGGEGRKKGRSRPPRRKREVLFNPKGEEERGARMAQKKTTLPRWTDRVIFTEEEEKTSSRGTSCSKRKSVHLPHVGKKKRLPRVGRGSENNQVSSLASHEGGRKKGESVEPSEKSYAARSRKSGEENRGVGRKGSSASLSRGKKGGKGGVWRGLRRGQKGKPKKPTITTS